MTRLIVLLMAILSASTVILSAQDIPPVDLQVACRTLASLTAEATAANRSSDVLLYKATADRIRARLGGGCEATYFTAVVAHNPGLQAAGLYLRIDLTKPIKGWKHDEVDRIFNLAEKESPSLLLKRLQVTDPTFDVDLEKLLKDVRELKLKRPELFQVPASDGNH